MIIQPSHQPSHQQSIRQGTPDHLPGQSRMGQASVSGQRLAVMNAPQKKSRLIALDLFRGATIAAMIIVNTPGNYTSVYPILQHAQWDAITPTDLIFPFFLFIAGTALAFVLRPYLQLTPGDLPRSRSARLYVNILRRAAILVLLGLFLNAFPEFNLATLRIPGVLQRIGLCYLLAALILLNLPLRWQWVLGAGILVAYALVLHFVGAPGVPPGQLQPFANLPRWVDRTVFGPAHVFQLWPTEPEGLLSTPAALVTTLLGCWTGLWLANRPISGKVCGLLGVSGAVFVGLGWAWGHFLPMVKMIWTPSYVLFTGGWALIVLAGCCLVTEVWRARSWAWVLEVLGRNAILAYVLSEMGASLLNTIRLSGVPVTQLVTRFLVRLGSGPKLGSLLYAVLFTALIWCLLYVPYRRRWFLRI